MVVAVAAAVAAAAGARGTGRVECELEPAGTGEDVRVIWVLVAFALHVQVAEPDTWVQLGLAVPLDVHAIPTGIHTSNTSWSKPTI